VSSTIAVERDATADGEPAAPTASVRPASGGSRPPLAVLAILLVAAAVRMGHLGSPPTDFHVTRQYNDVLLAHSFYTDVSGAGSARDKEIARLDRPPILEPPILESATVGVDLLLGHETLVFPRLVSIWAWVLSGLTLFAIGRRLLGRVGATVAVGAFELLPFMVVATRGFQPDPLAVAAMLVAVLAALRWSERPTGRRFVALGAIAAGAILVKADFAPFVIAGECAAVWIATSGPVRARLRALFGWKQLVWLGVALLPSMIWTEFFFQSSLPLSVRINQYFIPDYLLHHAYWSNMWGELTAVFGVTVLVIAVAGFVLAKGPLRAVLVGAVAAYIVFMVAFDYRVATHSYYQLPAVPFVALAVGHTVDVIVGVVRRWGFAPLVPRMLAAATVAVVAVAVWREDRLPSVAGGEAEVAAARTIGAALCRPMHAIWVDVAYGEVLDYHGDMAGMDWPLAADDALTRLQGQSVSSARERLAQDRSAGARYVVSTTPLTGGMPPDLAQQLQRFPVVLEGKAFEVWDLDPGAPSPCQGGRG